MGSPRLSFFSLSHTLALLLLIFLARARPDAFSVPRARSRALPSWCARACSHSCARARYLSRARPRTLILSRALTRDVSRSLARSPLLVSAHVFVLSDNLKKEGEREGERWALRDFHTYLSMNASTSSFVWTPSCDTAAFIMKKPLHTPRFCIIQNISAMPTHTHHRTRALVSPHHGTVLRSRMLVCAQALCILSPHWQHTCSHSLDAPRGPVSGSAL